MAINGIFCGDVKKLNIVDAMVRYWRPGICCALPRHPDLQNAAASVPLRSAPSSARTPLVLSKAHLIARCGCPIAHR